MKVKNVTCLYLWHRDDERGDPKAQSKGKRGGAYAHLRGAGDWTDKGIENVKETMERTDRGIELAKKHGTEFKQAFWTVGLYDMVAVFESPDDETLSAHLLEICASVSVRTMTMRAYDREEMSGILQRVD